MHDVGYTPLLQYCDESLAAYAGTGRVKVGQQHKEARGMVNVMFAS